MAHLKRNLYAGLLLLLLPVLAGLLIGCSGDPVALPTPESNSDEISAVAQDKAMNPQIFCQGTKCTRPGEPIQAGYPRRDYSYIVDPGFSYIDRLEIGIEHTSYQISNVIVPAGWSWQIIPGNHPHNGRMPTVPHGNQRAINGNCGAVILFTGPSLMSKDQFAFDFDAPPHVVNWHAENWIWGWNFDANWGSRIGRGDGPVHGPKRRFIPIDPTSIDQITPQ